MAELIATDAVSPAPSWPMYRALVGIGMLCGLLIVSVFVLTGPIIARNEARALEAAVFRVLPGATVSHTFLLTADGRFQSAESGPDAGSPHAEADAGSPYAGTPTQSADAGADFGSPDAGTPTQSGDPDVRREGGPRDTGTPTKRSGTPTDRVVHAGYDDAGSLVGVAIQAQGMGYQDVIRILYGYDPEREAVIGMQVLASKETPGLGDKIEKDPAFLANFDALDVSLGPDGQSLQHPVEAVKGGQKSRPWQIDGITGATISSKAIAKMLRESTATWIPLIHRQRDIFIDSEVTNGGQ